ncbi:MAG: FAD-dependent oxidoreductase [Candidatus Gracilibacteria bacterium]|nr:FAD-dependent oxidoreductase [Candidatus Gracilibacteria bacterium]
MKTPVLIIGSGLAGLSTAYRLAQMGVECTVVTKASEMDLGTNSAYAQGGIVYRPEGEDVEDLIADILAAGAGINSRQAVDQISEDGIDMVREVLLDDLKVPFDRVDGKLSFTREAAHSSARIIHSKDQTGKVIMESFKRVLLNHPKVTFLYRHMLVDLLTTAHHCSGYEMKYEQNWCIGSYLLDLDSGEVKTMTSYYTVLATGGIGQLYEHHTNAEHAYGSGLAVATRANVRIINAHFVQFHPTALWSPKTGRRFLISEALRGEGARLKNNDGRYIMDSFSHKDLESRAVVSRAVLEDMEKTGDDYVLLNLADYYHGSVPLSERFPSIYDQCMKQGIDMGKDSIPVVPAQHFFCGGIKVGKHGHTELPGLFAVGEVSCTGVHGANRLASTSLLECLTWGTEAGKTIAGVIEDLEQDPDGYLQQSFDVVLPWESFGDAFCDESVVEQKKDQIRALMWENVGVLRTQEKLFFARDELRSLWKDIQVLYSVHELSEPLLELRHMIESAYLIAHSAASYTNLKDSLGGHVVVKGRRNEME